MNRFSVLRKKDKGMYLNQKCQEADKNKKKRNTKCIFKITEIAGTFSAKVGIQKIISVFSIHLWENLIETRKIQ